MVFHLNRAISAPYLNYQLNHAVVSLVSAGPLRSSLITRTRFPRVLSESSFLPYFGSKRKPSSLQRFAPIGILSFLSNTSSEKKSGSLPTLFQRSKRLISRFYQGCLKVSQWNLSVTLREPSGFIRSLRKSTFLSTNLKTFDQNFATFKPPFVLPKRLQEKPNGVQEIFNPIISTPSSPTFSQKSTESEEGLDFYFPRLPPRDLTEPVLKIFIPIKSKIIIELQNEKIDSNSFLSSSTATTSSDTLFDFHLLSQLQLINEAYEEHSNKISSLEGVENLIQIEEVKIGEEILGWYYTFESLKRTEDLGFIKKILGSEISEVESDEVAVQNGRNGGLSVLQ